MISPPSGNPDKKPWEQRGEVGLAVEIVGAGKGRIGGDAQPPRLAAKREAQYVEHQLLGQTQARRRARAAALPDPGAGRGLRRHLEHRVAHLRKQLHVLMAVDEVGRAAERHDEGFHLRGDLDRQPLDIEPALIAARIIFCSGGKWPRSSGAKPALSGLNGAVSVTCRPSAARCFAGIELIERVGFAGVEVRRRRHHRGRVEAPAQRSIRGWRH